ncbi:MAG: hypothetical protein JXR60_01450 [Bacteroidales bacterium]|nr:hypothetical protein [Bacteroidales bacterium]
MKRIIILSVIFTTLSSTIMAYVPPIINSSILSQKGEFQGAFTYGSSGAEQYLSYAFDESLSVLVNSSFTIDTMYNGSTKRKHFFFEGGFNYGKQAGSWVFTMGGMYGYGQYYTLFSGYDEYNYNSYRFYGLMDFHKFSIQGDIGIKKSFFELVFTHRFAVGYAKVDNPMYPINSSTQSYFEPGITLKAGPGKIKFFTQARLSLPLNDRNYNMNYGAISLGFIVHLGYKADENNY